MDAEIGEVAARSGLSRDQEDASSPLIEPATSGSSAMSKARATGIPLPGGGCAEDQQVADASRPRTRLSASRRRAIGSTASSGRKRVDDVAPAPDELPEADRGRASRRPGHVDLLRREQLDELALRRDSQRSRIAGDDPTACGHYDAPCMTTHSHARAMHALHGEPSGADVAEHIGQRRADTIGLADGETQGGTQGGARSGVIAFTSTPFSRSAAAMSAEDADASPTASSSPRPRTSATPSIAAAARPWRCAHRSCERRPAPRA